MDSQSNKKPIDEVVILIKQLKKDISQLQTDVSYIKKRLYADQVEKQLKEDQKKEDKYAILDNNREEPSSGWFW